MLNEYYLTLTTLTKCIFPRCNLIISRYMLLQQINIIIQYFELYLRICSTAIINSINIMNNASSKMYNYDYVVKNNISTVYILTKLIHTWLSCNSFTLNIIQVTAAVSSVSYHYMTYHIDSSEVNLPPTSRSEFRLCATWSSKITISIAINRSTCMTVLVSTWLGCWFPQSQIIRPVNIRGYIWKQL